mmetsp:Transcript_143694/g.459812  ORF Transcript_143694/g.459812 Transcript_143694/m.459812 type:complete len:330 (-) Transcript_143694:183-1172(-)
MVGVQVPVVATGDAQYACHVQSRRLADALARSLGQDARDPAQQLGALRPLLVRGKVREAANKFRLGVVWRPEDEQRDHNLVSREPPLLQVHQPLGFLDDVLGGRELLGGLGLEAGGLLHDLALRRIYPVQRLHAVGPKGRRRRPRRLLSDHLFPQLLIDADHAVDLGLALGGSVGQTLHLVRQVGDPQQGDRLVPQLDLDGPTRMPEGVLAGSVHLQRRQCVLVEVHVVRPNLDEAEVDARLEEDPRRTVAVLRGHRLHIFKPQRPIEQAHLQVAFHHIQGLDVDGRLPPRLAEGAPASAFPGKLLGRLCGRWQAEAKTREECQQRGAA